MIEEEFPLLLDEDFLEELLFQFEVAFLEDPLLQLDVDFFGEPLLYELVSFLPFASAMHKITTTAIMKNNDFFITRTSLSELYAEYI